ncbi:hypothetical protein BGZ97_001790 [Linnemannia gamsii]|uniref:F-box domain-containing protein n=1 Tax=Linnemannia gamsii TaxID=64522 RepID=A0A9P6UIZ7_9FUNG|nr:hypothetical protein BGZ97_001790 [Linnemannia gamsii]
MEQVPVEIILAIGLFFDAPSLSASLRVCRKWHRTLQPLVWHSISEHQWYHPSFPIQQCNLAGKKAIYSASSLASDISLAPQLRQTISLGWTYSLELSEETHISHLQPPIPQVRLAKILSLAVNLVDLSLRVDVHQFAACFLEALSGLTKLKRLSIFVPHYAGTTVTIDPILPILTRLEYLELCGPWFEQDHLQLKHEEYVKLQLAPTNQTWGVKTFKIDSISLIHSLRFCPDLVGFEFTRYISMLRTMEGSWPLLTKYLYRMTQLRTIKFGTSRIEESEEERAVRLAGGVKSLAWIELPRFFGHQ